MSNILNQPQYYKSHNSQYYKILEEASIKLKRNKITHPIKNIVYLISGIIVYLFFIVLSYSGFQIPSDPVKLKNIIDSESSITSTYHHDEITRIMYFLKAICFFIAIIFLLFGLLLNRIRNKNKKLMFAYDTISALKKDYISE